MTKLLRSRSGALVALVLAVAACAAPAATPAPTASPATGGATSSPAVGPGSGAPASPDGGTAVPTVDAAAPARAAIEGRAWGSATLTDVATGQPFRIADFAGRTVFVESMAIWCTNCRAQQGRFREALAQLDPADVAYVVLTVDPSETGDALAAYRQQQDFSGTYAVAGPDVSAALVSDFGPLAINPPSVPLILIRPDGTISFATGGESVEEIVALVGA